MKKVVGVETLLVTATRRVHAWAGLSTAMGRDYVLVRVRSDRAGAGQGTGAEGLGQQPRALLGESPQTTVAVVRDYLAPALGGADPLALEGAYAPAWTAPCAAIPTPRQPSTWRCTTWQGTRRHLHYLGGQYRDRVPVAHGIGLMETDAAVAEAVQAVEEGIRTIKLKSATDRDVDLVHQVRAAVGDGVALRVDANQGYPTGQDQPSRSRGASTIRDLVHGSRRWRGSRAWRASPRR